MLSYLYLKLALHDKNIYVKIYANNLKFNVLLRISLKHFLKNTISN